LKKKRMMTVEDGTDTIAANEMRSTMTTGENAIATVRETEIGTGTGTGTAIVDAVTGRTLMTMMMARTGRRLLSFMAMAGIAIIGRIGLGSNWDWIYFDIYADMFAFRW
jgi:hypothetical protein